MPYDFSQLKDEFKKVEEWLSGEYSRVHTGRATPVVLDPVLVETYGGSHARINQIASIGIEDPRTLRITPWDKNQIKDIERAVKAANLGLSVSTDSDGLRAQFPQLTGEDRERLVKTIKDKLEEARIKVRLEREKVWDDIQAKARGGEIDEDEKFRLKEEMEKIVDEVNVALEDIFAKKERDITTL